MVTLSSAARRENYFFPRGHHPRRGARPGRYMPEACTLSQYPSYLTSRYGNTSKHNEPEGGIMGMRCLPTVSSVRDTPHIPHLETSRRESDPIRSDPIRAT